MKPVTKINCVVYSAA